MVYITSLPTFSTEILSTNTLRSVGQSLCLPQTCPIYTIQPSDTCYGIAGNANITYTQLLSWNPSINGYCSNLITGQNICIGQPGTVWTGTTIAGATPTKTDIYASATIAPPGPTAHGESPWFKTAYSDIVAKDLQAPPPTAANITGS